MEKKEEEKEKSSSYLPAGLIGASVLRWQRLDHSLEGHPPDMGEVLQRMTPGGAPRLIRDNGDWSDYRHFFTGDLVLVVGIAFAPWSSWKNVELLVLSPLDENDNTNVKKFCVFPAHPDVWMKR